jgi:hypothetical protein
LTKKQGLALKRWQKLIQGIQIRRRMQHQYGDHEAAGPVSSALLITMRIADPRLSVAGTRCCTNSICNDIEVASQDSSQGVGKGGRKDTGKAHV